MAREMKDSGIAWIGEIPREWKMSRVGLHYDIILGKMLCTTQPNNDYTLEPYYCAANIHFDGISNEAIKEMWFSVAEKELYRVKQNDLLVVEGGAGAGGCAIVPNLQHDVYIQNSVMIVRPKAEQCSRFLRYLIEHLVKSGYIDVVCNKATIPHFTKDKLANVPIPLSTEQRRIADFLDAECARIDAVIEQTRASIEEYKKLKQSVITQAVTKGIRPGRKMKDSGIEWIGEIPEEWHVDKIKKVAAFYNGDRSNNYPSGDDIVDEGVLFVTSNNLGNMVLNTEISTNKYITEAKYNEMRGAKLRPDDIIFCLRGSVGKCSINKTFLEGTIASSLVLIRPKHISPDYLNYVLHHPKITEVALLAAIGIGSQNLAAADIEDFKIPIPTGKDEAEIVEYLNKVVLEIERLIWKAEGLAELLESYKKSLIFEYVTGKKEVV